MEEDDLIKEVQMALSYLIEVEDIKSYMVKLAHSGMTPKQVASHVREIVIKYSLKYKY